MCLILGYYSNSDLIGMEVRVGPGIGLGKMPLLLYATALHCIFRMEKLRVTWGTMLSVELYLPTADTCMKDHGGCGVSAVALRYTYSAY